MSKFGCSPELAGSLYGTEYEYEYTKDGKQFAVKYIRHFNQNIGNNIIHETIYDDSSEAATKIFAAVVPDQTVGKAWALIARMK
jgi:hypothetical protein